MTKIWDPSSHEMFNWLPSQAYPVRYLAASVSRKNEKNEREEARFEEGEMKFSREREKRKTKT